MAVILIVEDDELLGRMMCRAFESQGIDAYWAQNFNDLQEAIEAQKVQLILLDIMLPEKDGIEILRWLKSPTNPQKDIPVIMLSNIKDTEHIEAAQALGAKDYYLKVNVNPQTLAQELKEKYIRE